MRNASLCFLAALAIAPVAAGQIPLPDAPTNRPSASVLPQAPEPAIASLISVLIPNISAREPVTGLPFSATATIVSEQTLADGTTIRNSADVLLWRDAEGKMRADCKWNSSGSAPQNHIVIVSDPSAGTLMSWSAGKQIQLSNIATMIHLPDLKMAPAISRPELLPPGTPASSQNTSAPARTLHDLTASGVSGTNARTETLPHDTIAGLDVEGTRTTQAIPVGALGNDREIDIASEVWTSPELKIAIRQMTNDPRTGKVTFEWNSVDRSDPDPSLFKVPDGYKMLDMPTPPAAAPSR
jgi:hypothetical protein